MVTYSASTRSSETFRRLGQFGGALFFAASFLPAILIVRELLVYNVLGVALPGFLSVLNSFVLVLKHIVNPTSLLGHGVWAVPIIIFVETGLFFGFFLPGDSLLLTVGVLGAAGYVDLTALILFSILGAIVGDQLGYAIGRLSGDVLARRFRFVRENVSGRVSSSTGMGAKRLCWRGLYPLCGRSRRLLLGRRG